ncbi:glycosyltransferase family 4 protein [Schaalia suimastitidis]|uniref:glycosyltransferase family 4 protein n=1 Tax=Schaalia suimastitidis TaxID=121163 RepID=UPI0004233D8A|nr:glycosyltransferase family 4 protein [Schaalia suimastitidis]
MKPRIAYILKVYPRFSETFIVTEILAREAAGEDISIYSLRPTKDSRFHPEIARVQAGVTWISRPTTTEELWESITASLAGTHEAERFAQILPALATLPPDEVAQGLELAYRLQADGITHMHAHFASLAGRVAWIASQLSGIPFTVTTHAKDIFHTSVDPRWLSRVLTGAHRVIAISKYNERYLHNFLQGQSANISLLRNGIELSRFPMKDRHDVGPVLRLLAVGRLVPKKGFDVLIEAVAWLRDNGIDFRLDIAGEGECADELNALIARLHLGEHVHMLGARTQAEVRALLEDADIFLAPCRVADDGNMDGLPTVLLESMAVGTPVVATAVTGIPELVRNGETGVLLDEAEATSLAQAIVRLAADATHRRLLATNARNLLEIECDARRQARTLGQWESAEQEQN